MRATEVTSPDELMTVLKRYPRESNESETVVATRIGINRHTLNRWHHQPKPDERQFGVNRRLPPVRGIAVSVHRFLNMNASNLT
jgi:hypothetical protein